MIESTEQVVKLAENFRSETLGLKPHEPIDNSFKLAEKAGFFIIALPLGESFDKTHENGFYIKIGVVKFIFINSTVFKSTQNYTIWHEVYHSLNSIDTSKASEEEIKQDEQYAEVFSSLILLPMQALEYELKSNLKRQQLFSQDIHRISIKYRLHYRAVLKQARDNYNEFNRLGFLFSKENETNRLTLVEKDELASLYATGNKYISTGIFEAIESNYKNGLITQTELDEINGLIEEVASIE